MDTPGTVLRSERERQQKTLKDIARKLKINIKYLEAIEDDDYTVLPAEVFARSYIRLYADELELDSVKLLALFEHIGKPPAPDVPEPQQPAAPPPPPREDGPKKPLRPVLLAVAAGALIVLIYFISQNTVQKEEHAVPVSSDTAPHETKPSDMKEDQKTGEPEAPQVNDKEEHVAKPVSAAEKEGHPVTQEPLPAAGEPSVTQMPVLQEEKPSPKPVPAAVQEDAVQTPETAPPVERPAPVKKAPDESLSADKKPAPPAVIAHSSGEMALKITATELTWVSLSIDGGKQSEWHLRPGQTITLNANDSFRGKIGNAGGTRLSLNGRDLGELGPPGKIIDIALP